MKVEDQLALLLTKMDEQSKTISGGEEGFRELAATGRRASRRSARLRHRPSSAPRRAPNCLNYAHFSASRARIDRGEGAGVRSSGRILF
jgi:hypothetical protein